MPVDVEYYEWSNAGSVLHAEWTEAARANLRTALDAYFEASGGDTQIYAPPDDLRRARLHVQLQKLHRAVAQTIVDHAYAPPGEAPSRLPTKSGLDWTLGEEARDLHDYYAADYALFLFVTGAVPSATRVFTAAVAGISEYGGSYSSVSLVDLLSGDLVWFSHEVTPLADPVSERVVDALPDSWNKAGDLRRPEMARRHVEFLLRGLAR
jgi:hypothetical protein